MMNDQRTSYGTKDKRSSVQQICIYFLVRKGLNPHLMLVGLIAGRLVDKTRVDFEIFNIPYMLNCLDFCFVNISAMSLIVLELHFSQLFSNKVYFKACFEVFKIRLPVFHVNPCYEVPAYLMI